MRKIFIDCGGYDATSVKRFIRSKEYDPSFEIFSFEPLKELSKHFETFKNVTLIQKAVWIFDGEIQMYKDTHPKKGEPWPGSTMFKSKKTGNLDKKHPITVPCINLSAWTTRNFSKKDYIILKMNIEGAEYPILEKMIQDNSISFVNKAYISFHWKKIGYNKAKNDKIVSKLRAILGKWLMPEMNDYLDRDEKIN